MSRFLSKQRILKSIINLIKNKLKIKGTPIEMEVKKKTDSIGKKKVPREFILRTSLIRLIFLSNEGMLPTLRHLLVASDFTDRHDIVGGNDSLNTRREVA